MMCHVYLPYRLISKTLIMWNSRNSKKCEAWKLFYNPVTFYSYPCIGKYTVLMETSMSNTEITKTVGPSARGRQNIARADIIFDPVGPTGRLKFDQTLTLFYYLFLYFRELELTYRYKDFPGQDIWRPRKRISLGPNPKVGGL